MIVTYWNNATGRSPLFEIKILDTCISRTIATMEDTNELTDEKLQIFDVIFNLGLKINKFLSYSKEEPNKPVREGIRLPNIIVSIFDGDH